MKIERQHGSTSLYIRNLVFFYNRVANGLRYWKQFLPRTGQYWFCVSFPWISISTVSDFGWDGKFKGYRLVWWISFRTFGIGIT
ncbi:hypothetical protein LCGC14_1030310 [marine sediment metagenome]|uniref:Uncharacterized protein n=1 Tax=marine sediment metagenome TaxID=412755 RepID=A0A0F9NGI0_9ZZZZ